MKKLFFVFVMTAFAANTFASENGCLNNPSKNDGHCVASTYGGEVRYYCLDSMFEKHCVKSNDVDG